VSSTGAATLTFGASVSTLAVAVTAVEMLPTLSAMVKV